MLKLLLRLSTLSLGLSCVVCATSAQTQLASLNERLNQVLNTLYASPLLSTKTAAEVEEISNTPVPETSYIVTSGPPQVVYVSQSPYLESGAQPNDFGSATETHPVTRAAWPYPYASSSPALTQLSPQKFSSYPLARSYPEPQRFAYPQIPSPIGPSLPPAFPSLAHYPSPYPGPLPYPSNMPSNPPTLPPVGPPLPFSQVYPSVPQPPFSFSPASPFSFPSLCPSPAPYPSYPLSSYPSSPSSFPSFASQGFPSLGLPSPYSPTLSPLPSNYPPIPSPYPSSNAPSGYSLAAFGSQSLFSPPAFPKYSELLHHPFHIGAN